MSAARLIGSAYISNPIKDHGSKRFQSREKPENETHDSLETHFEEMLTEGKTFATRTTRAESGMWFDSDAIDDAVLPPHASKFSFYARWN